MVEFALLLPVVFTLLLALVRIGLIGRDAMLVLQAARSGAREAAVTADETAIRAALIDGGTGLDPARIEFGITREGSRGDPVSVQVRYVSPTGIAWGWLPESVSLGAQAVMRQEFG